MKKVLLFCCAFVFYSCIQASASLISVNTSDSGDYFSAESMVFMNKQEEASYESDFGLFSMMDPTDRYQIFSYDQEPGATAFVTATDWASLTTGFGFYFNVRTGGNGDSTVDYNWFSDSSLNQFADGTAVDTTVDHIWTNLISQDLLMISLDDQLGGGDRDFNDMKIRSFAEEISSVPAPVPEPETIFLIGIGLAGLTSIHRRKKRNLEK